MDDLFRFVALRAPDIPDPDQISLATGSDFQGALAGIHQTATSPASPPASNQPVRGAVRPAMTRLSIGSLAGSTVVSGSVSAAAGAPSGASFVPPPSPTSPVQAAVKIAEAYIKGAYGGRFIRDPRAQEPFGLGYGSSFDDLYAAISVAGENLKLNDLAKLVQDTFKKSATTLAAEFQKKEISLFDSIVAIFIHPLAQANYSVADLVQSARLMNLIERIARQDKSLEGVGAITAAFSKTFLLPPPVFPLRTDLPKPVGVGDLLVVRQHIKRYELGEIANIENILLGESRDKATKHTLTMDRTLVTETEKTTETTSELATTERFELKTEAENVIKEDTSAKAGVSVSAKYGSVEINANAEVSYSLSKSQSTKASVDHAKDVTNRAATKVTERVRRQETIRTIETFEETEDHAFDNKGGQKNISGLYQWVNKVYESQIYNYGKRLLFDLMIPEPAAFLLDSLRSQQPQLRPPDPFSVITGSIFPGGIAGHTIAVIAGSTTILKPYPATFRDVGPDGYIRPDLASRPITPADLSLDPDDPSYYGIFAAKYGAAGIKAPPEEFITVSKGLSSTRDQGGHLLAADDLNIPTGYQAIEIAVQGAFNPSESSENIDGNEFMWVFVGKSQFPFQLNVPGNKLPIGNCII